LTTVVLDVSGLLFATEKFVIEAVLRRRPGIHGVQANPVSQTATVTFDQDLTSVRELARCVEGCGYHSVGQSVPAHLCDPIGELVSTLPAPEGKGAVR
jgi:Cu2+-exporting ATPase